MSNCLIIGSGSIGERHAKNLIKFFEKNVFVVSRFPEKKFRDEFLNLSDKAIKISIDQLNDVSTFELLIFATPSSIRSINLDLYPKLKIKFIYTEVPAAVSFLEWNKLKEFSLRIGARIFSGYNMRFHPGLIQLKKLSSDQFISLRGIFGEYLPDLHKWEDYRTRYEAIKTLGGGPLLTSHHEIDLAIWLMGKVESVACIMRNTILKIDANDHAIVSLFHENGSISNLDLNFFYKKYVRSIEIATSKEIITYEPFHDGLKIGEKEIISFKNYDFNKTYIASIKEALSGECSKSPTIEEIDHLMRVTNACLKSNDNNGKIIKV